MAAFEVDSHIVGVCLGLNEKEEQKEGKTASIGFKTKVGGLGASKPIQTELAKGSVVKHLLKTCKVLGQSSGWKNAVHWARDTGKR